VASTTRSPPPSPPDRALSPDEWRLLLILGLPTFAYALATTVASTYLPVLASEFTGSSTVVGLLIAIEGLMALLIAVPAGAASDHRISRLPFVIIGSPILVVALALMGFVQSLGLAIVCVTVFFAAYFLAYEPYRALYPDLVDAEISGRGQSTQALWRGLGTILAIAGGGVLLTVGRAGPFLAGAAVTAIAVIVFLRHLPRGREPIRQTSDVSLLGADLRRLGALMRRRGDLRAFMLANALWELSLGATKTFIILYLTKGLDAGTSTAAFAVTAAAVFIAIASPVSGKLADRFGVVRVMQLFLTLYGVGLAIPFVVHDRLVIAAITPLIAFGGGVVMTLPYALLIPLMGHDDHGLTTGLYSVSRGVGTALGPLLAGVAIQVLQGPFAATEGYQAMWGVCALAILISVPILQRLRAPGVRASLHEL
jgi:MFS family permease